MVCIIAHLWRIGIPNNGFQNGSLFRTLQITLPDSQHQQRNCSTGQQHQQRPQYSQKVTSKIRKEFSLFCLNLFIFVGKSKQIGGRRGLLSAVCRAHATGEIQFHVSPRSCTCYFGQLMQPHHRPVVVLEDGTVAHGGVEEVPESCFGSRDLLLSLFFFFSLGTQLSDRRVPETSPFRRGYIANVRKNNKKVNETRWLSTRTGVECRLL